MKKILIIFLLLNLISFSAFGGVDFDGDDDTFTWAGVDVTTNFIAYMIGFTLNATPASNEFLVVTDDASQPDFFRLLVDTNGNCVGAMNNGAAGDNTASVTGSIQVDDGEYHEVLLVRTALKEIAMYVDGISEGSDSYADGGTGLDSDLLVYFGNSSSGTSSINGTIHHIAYWFSSSAANMPTLNDALLIFSSKIKRFSLQIKNSFLDAYWPFDDLPDGTSYDGKIAQDISGNRNDATGDDGANNTGLTAKAENVLSYP